MKVGIVGNAKEWHIQKLLKAFRESGAEAHVFPVTKIKSQIGSKPNISAKGYSLDEYDAMLVRRIPGGTAEQVFYRMDVLHMLEQSKTLVVNPSHSIEKAVNKHYTSALLEKAGILTPKTIVTESFSEALKAFNELGGDVIVKPIFGSLGAGMTRVSSKDIAYRVFRALEMARSVYYLQEYIPHDGRDIRVFTVGEKVVASMERISSSWKTNISGGGKPSKYKPDDEEVEVSLRSAETLGLEYSGVDLLRSKDDDKLYVLELNSTPGWQGLQTVSNTDITKAVVDHVISLLN